MAIIEAKASGALHPAARSVAPATFSGIFSFVQMMLMAGTRNSSHTSARAQKTANDDRRGEGGRREEGWGGVYRGPRVSNP